MDVPAGLCDGAPVSWTLQMGDGSGCVWSDCTSGPYSGRLWCDSGWWVLNIMTAGCGSGLCTYRRPAHGQGDCPEGTYDLVGPGCDSQNHPCPATIDVYYGL